MPATKKVSKRKTKPQELSQVGRDLIESLKEVLAHVRGEITLPSRTVGDPVSVALKALRKQLGLSQGEFSRRYGFSVRTLQDWEHGRSAPPSAARAYLTVIERHPDTVEQALLDAARKHPKASTVKTPARTAPARAASRPKRPPRAA